MTKIKIVLSLLLVAAMAFISQSAIAGKVIKDGPLKGDGMQEPKEARLDSKREKAPWIESWYIPDGGYMENGGFGPSAPIDHIDEATKGKLTQPKLSTIEGLLMTKDVLINFPKKHDELTFLKHLYHVTSHSCLLHVSKMSYPTTIPYDILLRHKP